MKRQLTIRSLAALYIAARSASGLASRDINKLNQGIAEARAFSTFTIIHW